MVVYAINIIETSVFSKVLEGCWTLRKSQNIKSVCFYQAGDNMNRSARLQDLIWVLSLLLFFSLTLGGA